MAAYKHRNYLHYAAVGIILLVIFLLQNSIRLLPPLFSVRPLPLIPAVICTAMFEREKVGFIAGLMCGILMDINSVRLCGFNAVILLIFGCVTGLLVTHLFTNSPLSAFFLSGCACLIYYVVYWLAFWAFSGTEGVLLYLVRYSLVGAAYTWLYTLPCYLIFRAISRRNIQ